MMRNRGGGQASRCTRTRLRRSPRLASSAGGTWSSDYRGATRRRSELAAWLEGRKAAWSSLPTALGVGISKAPCSGLWLAASPLGAVQFSVGAEGDGCVEKTSSTQIVDFGRFRSLPEIKQSTLKSLTFRGSATPILGARSLLLLPHTPPSALPSTRATREEEAMGESPVGA